MAIIDIAMLINLNRTELPAVRLEQVRVLPNKIFAIGMLSSSRVTIGLPILRVKPEAIIRF